LLYSAPSRSSSEPKKVYDIFEVFEYNVIEPTVSLGNDPKNIDILPKK